MKFKSIFKLSKYFLIILFLASEDFCQEAFNSSPDCLPERDVEENECDNLDDEEDDSKDS